MAVMVSRYQPTKEETGEEIVMDASPDELARVVVQDVEIRLVDP